MRNRLIGTALFALSLVLSGPVNAQEAVVITIQACTPTGVNDVRDCKTYLVDMSSANDCLTFLADPRVKEGALLVAAAGNMPVGGTIAAWCPNGKVEVTIPAAMP